MDSNSGGGFFTGVVVTLIVVSLIWGIGSGGKYEGQTAQEWYDENSSTEEDLQSYKSALDQANSNIEDAKSEAWSDYNNMGYTLDNLETVDGP
jgi:hypothetical protein